MKELCETEIDYYTCPYTDRVGYVITSEGVYHTYIDKSLPMYMSVDDAYISACLKISNKY